MELNGVSGVSPASISVTQAPNNQLCKSLSDLPADSASLDLSGRNPSPSLRLADGTFARFTQLGSLDLSGNLLSGFRPAVFDGLDRLEALDLSRNRFTSLPELAFSNLPGLETLSLRGNGMERMHEAAFHAAEGGFSPLRSLDLGRNRLGAVPEFAFRDLVALETLRLDGNRIGGLGQYDLFGPNELRRLNLARNDIATVHADAFAEAFGDGDGVPSRLTHLWLGGNRIARLPAGAFSELAQLRVLDLSRNRLSDPADLGRALDGLDGLRSLDLSGNGLAGLPDGALSTMDELEHLWLYRNSLAELPVGVLSDLASLRTLSLSGNGIAALPDNAFEGLDALEELWLLDNRIEALTGRTFAGLGSLRSLSMGGNRLARLPDGAFSDLAALESLWLRGNRIGAVAPGAFDGLGSLRFLDLSGNPLNQRPLPARACAFLRGVETLRLDDGLSLEAICPN